MQNAVVIGATDLQRMIAEAVRDGVQQALPSEPIQTAETLITENELRQVTGLSHPTVTRLRKQGKLPFLRVGEKHPVQTKRSDGGDGEANVPAGGEREMRGIMYDTLNFHMAGIEPGQVLPLLDPKTAREVARVMMGKYGIRGT